METAVVSVYIIICLSTRNYASIMCVIIAVPPDPHPPRSLHARSTTSTTATIAWSSPQPQSFLPISQYSLSLADQLFGLPQINVTVNSTKLSYTFSGLEEFDLLKCDIVSVSSYGGISISASITLRTNVAGLFL